MVSLVCEGTVEEGVSSLEVRRGISSDLGQTETDTTTDPPTSENGLVTRLKRQTVEGLFGQRGTKKGAEREEDGCENEVGGT